MQTVGEAVAKSKPSPPKPAWDPAWSRFAGLYRSMWGDVEVVELDGRLAMIDPTSDDPGEQQQLIPLGGGTFRLEAKSGGSAVGEVVSFVERGGRVMRLPAPIAVPDATVCR
jgi:hypothetical protein